MSKHSEPFCDVTNVERVKTLCAALGHPNPSSDDAATMVIDTLATLRHVCDMYGVTFYECASVAHQHYLHERKHGA